MKRLIALTLLTGLLCGCSSQTALPATEPAAVPTESTITQTQPTTVTEPPATVTEPTVTEPTQPEGISLTLTFTGDCTLGTNQEHTYPNSFHAYYDENGPDYFLSDVRHIFETDDLTVVNLEGSLTNSTYLEDKQWNHKGPPEYVSILAGSSVEVATMGNNHRLDYGYEGFVETKQVLDEAGIGYCYDNRYLVREVKGIQVGFVSVNYIYDKDRVIPWLEEGYETLRKQGCDLVIACVHWGTGHSTELDAFQLDMGCRLIDMGYDLVVGNHPHVLQAMRVYKGKFICYSLGNFCYGGSKNPADKDSGIFQQTFTFLDGQLQPGVNARFIPCRISGIKSMNDYCPVPVIDMEFDRIIQKINGYSAGFDFAWDEDGLYTTP